MNNINLSYSENQPCRVALTHYTIPHMRSRGGTPETQVRNFVFMKREPITKKTRFEVFKRDKFQCAYCGRSAPDIVLNLEHIKPVSKGGGNELTNLITSCFDCNSGKSDRELSDDSVLKKQLKQAQELADRREQIEMMGEWINGLKSLQEDTIAILETHWFNEFPDYSWNQYGKATIQKLLKTYSIVEITEAMDIAKTNYITDFQDQSQTTLAFNKIGGICHNTKKGDDPILKHAYYCRSVIKNRITLYKPDWQILAMLREMIEYYGHEQIIHFCKVAKNWTAFRDAYLNYQTERDAEDTDN